MDFREDEINLVHSMWNDESQDVDYIANETDLPRNIVIEILQYLSDNKKIRGFILKEGNILMFEEMIDIDDYFSLDLHKISTPNKDKDYFFSKERLDINFNKGPFTANVKSKSYKKDCVILEMTVHYLDESFSIIMFYDNDESVYFRTENPETLDNFYMKLGDNLYHFFDFTQEILDKIIPYDFWETKAKFN